MDHPPVIDGDALYQAGVTAHRNRALDQARPYYEAALKIEPSRPPTEDELALLHAHAPILYITPSEPLPLRHFAGILHPDRPLIGYHMFWEDDIDFPDDGEPCDHEVIWVRYDPSSASPDERVLEVLTYYHGKVLTAAGAPEDAKQRHGRPRLDVQWGKHGTLPVGWQTIDDGAIYRDMQATFQRLKSQGIRKADHPLAKAWPKRFEGDWEAFTDFAVEVDTLPWLKSGVTARVGRYANAILAQEILDIHFAAKYSWPDLSGSDAGVD